MIKVLGLKLHIGEEEIILTIDEARELKGALDELFEKEEIHHYDRWYPPLVYPRTPFYGTIASGDGTDTINKSEVEVGEV